MTIDAPVDGFARVASIDTHAATPADTSHANIIINCARGLPKFWELPDFNKPKRRGEAIALIGGGPSLKYTIGELHQFKRSIACGSVHDYLIENGIIPEFASCCDPDPISRAYFQNPSRKVKYLLASICEPALFEHLAGYDIHLWHSYSGDPNWLETMSKVEPGAWQNIAGGCTVGLRAISMAIMFGFTNIHFFGFDSCIEDGAHHAYEYATADERMQQTYVIKTGKDAPGEKTFVCEGYQLAQAYHFKLFVTQHGHMFDATFHGGGLLADYYDSYKAGVANALAALTPEQRIEYDNERAQFELREKVA